MVRYDRERNYYWVYINKFKLLRPIDTLEAANLIVCASIPILREILYNTSWFGIQIKVTESVVLHTPWVTIDSHLLAFVVVVTLVIISGASTYK